MQTGPWLIKMVHRSDHQLFPGSEAFWFPGLESDVLFLFDPHGRKNHISSLCLNPRSTQGHIPMVPSNWFTRSDKYLGVGSVREGTSFRLQGSWNISTNETAFMIGLISLYCNVLFHEHLPYQTVASFTAGMNKSVKTVMVVIYGYKMEIIELWQNTQGWCRERRLTNHD